jgi:hypothetical protein
MLVAWLFACAVELAAPVASGADQPALPADFWARWGDGRAELSGYRLTTPRYGELRQGEAVLIVVSETFTDRARVKSDGGHPDEFPVLKLNDHRSFQTGIYDYDLMTSAWLRLDSVDAPGRPTKVSMAMIEWCGSVYEQLVPRGGAARWTGHSYFDGEADRDVDLGWRNGGVHADLMPMLVRGITGEWPPVGGSVSVPWLPTLVHGRLVHREPAWGEAVITRHRETEVVEVPAGRFEASRVDVRAPEGDTTWWVEAGPERRLLRWSRSDGEVGELTGSTRLPYWELHGEGHEAHRAALGLETPTPPIAP